MQMSFISGLIYFFIVITLNYSFFALFQGQPGYEGFNGAKGIVGEPGWPVSMYQSSVTVQE